MGINNQGMTVTQVATSPSHIAMLAALAALIAACTIANVLLCSAAIFFYAFLDTALSESAVFLSLPCVRCLAFYCQHHVMLHAMKDDNTLSCF